MASLLPHSTGQGKVMRLVGVGTEGILTTVIISPTASQGPELRRQDVATRSHIAGPGTHTLLFLPPCSQTPFFSLEPPGGGRTTHEAAGGAEGASADAQIDPSLFVTCHLLRRWCRCSSLGFKRDP